MNRCTDALIVQLKLIKWWRSDPGKAYAAFLVGREVDGEYGIRAHAFATALHLYQKGHSVDEDRLAAAADTYEETLLTGVRLAVDVADVLNASATYWVSEEMGELLRQAHADIPPHPLDVADLPTPSGFVYFADPLRFDTVAVHAIHWNWYDKASTVDISCYLASNTDAAVAGMLPTLGGSWQRGTEPVGTLDRLLQSFWVLSSQRIAVAETQLVDRHMRKRAAKVGHVPEDGIRVVTLRRPTQEQTGGSRLVEWSCRWVVSGHWREQWYAKSEEHRPVWIAPYPKGPADKPLVLNDKVYRWVR